MLNHIHQWTRPLKRFPLKSLTLTTPLSSLTLTKPSASAAADTDPADTYDPAASLEILKCLKSKDLYSSSLCLKTLVDRLNSVQVDEVIGDLGVEDPELAIELFYLLKNEHGFRHSRVCSFVVAHVLAGKGGSWSCVRFYGNLWRKKAAKDATAAAKTAQTLPNLLGRQIKHQGLLAWRQGTSKRLGSLGGRHLEHWT